MAPAGNHVDAVAGLDIEHQFLAFDGDQLNGRRDLDAGRGCGLVADVDVRLLRDIGVSAARARCEAKKPFWRA